MTYSFLRNFLWSRFAPELRLTARSSDQRNQGRNLAEHLGDRGGVSLGRDERRVRRANAFIASKRRIPGCDGGLPPAFFALAREELLH
jgi:hypothetical protein